MTGRDIRFSEIAYILVISVILGFLMSIGRNILIPLITSGFFAMLIYPVCRFMEGLVRNRPLSILITLLLVTLVFAAIIWFFSRQFVPFISELDTIIDLIPQIFKQAVEWITSTFNLETATVQNWMAQNSTQVVNYLFRSIPSPTILFTTLGLLPVYSFLFLLYRTSFRQFLLTQVSETNRQQVNDIIKEILNLAQRYLFGQAMVVLILGLLNTTGLWLIGIAFPLFWGFLAAMLAIIPYIGTFVGGALPFLYALFHTDTVWQPIAVVLYYAGVQQLEGNLITPKVVGSSVKINPLAAIIALFFFGAIWGVAGLILTLPIVGIIRLIMSHITPFKPMAMLFSNEIYQDETTFLQRFNDERYRFLKHLIKKKK